MRKIQISITIFIFILLLFSYFIEETLFLSNINSSASDNELSTLRGKDLPPYDMLGNGIITPLNNPKAVIVGGSPYVFYTGDPIHIQNRFNSPETGSYAIVSQVIEIYLFKFGTTPTNDSYYSIIPETPAITNGSYPLNSAALSNDPTHGWMDTTFLVPDLSWLSSRGIQPGDKVQIYQYYPSGNVTAKIENLSPFSFTDIFTLSAFASLSPFQDFENPASGDDTFRQGENATAIISADNGSKMIENVSISVTLYDQITHTGIANGTNGIKYYLRDMTDNPNKTTNSEGKIKLIVNTTYPTTPEGGYYFDISGDFRWTGSNTSNYDGVDPNTNWYNITIDFTVLNEMDYVSISFISALPKGEYPTDPPLDPPNVNTTIVKFQVEATYAYGGNYNPIGLPVNATLENMPNGVILTVADGYSSSGNWGFTDLDGYIGFNITVDFPELWYDIVKNIKAIANLTSNSAPSYPPYPSCSPHRFMRNTTDGLNASVTQQISIDPDFWLGDTALFSINTTTIRPGEAARVEFEVFSSNDPSATFENVPVNIILTESIIGVTLSVINSPARSGYYFTDSSGILIVDVITTLATPATIQRINFTLTLDFENDSNVRWVGDQHKVDPPTTLEEFNSTWRIKIIRNELTIDPQYFIGKIFLPAGSPNATSIQQNETIQVEFNLKLTFENTGLDVNPASLISGVTVAIEIDGSSNPADFNMQVQEGVSQSSVDSSITFTIKTNVTGETLEKWYNLTAIVDFGSAQGLTYNVSHFSVPSGKLPGIWVKGADTDTLSKYTLLFRVKNIDRITTRIESIIDSTHPGDVGNIAGYYVVYRGTTQITVNGTYKDSAQNTVNYRSLIVSLNYTLGATTITQDITTTSTNDTGFFESTFNLSTSLPLTDIIIFARDATFPTPQEDRVGIGNVRLISTIDMSNYNIIGFNGTSVFVGEYITTFGTLKDDQGNTLISNELNGRLRVIGWSGTQEIGIPVIGSPSSTTGEYSLDYQIPSTFLGNDLFIRLNVTEGVNLIHYRLNYIEKTIKVYRGFQLASLQLIPSIGSSFAISNGNSYKIIGVNNRSFTITGILHDLIARPLANKEIKDIWNLVPIRRMVGSDGSFALSYSFPGWDNITIDWELYHILDNGTTLSTSYIITLQWEVYDTTPPLIEVNTPSYYDGTLPNQQNFLFNVSVTDPSNLDGYVSVGLDTSSVTIWINGSSYLMNYGGGSLFYYDWTPSNMNDGIFYNITITARDLGGEEGTTGTIWTIIDVVAPIAVFNEVDEYPSEYARVTPEGNVIISGTITDSASSTGYNSGLDNSSVRILLRSTETGPIILNESVILVGNNFIYNWTIILDANDLNLLRRDPNFITSEIWLITVSYSDIAGNYGISNSLEVKIDNQAPYLAITNSDQWPNQIEENDSINIIITFHDHTPLKSGLNNQTLTFELVDNDTQGVLEIFGSDDVIFIENGAILNLDITDLDSGLYFIRVRIFDNTGNKAEIIEYFTIPRPKAPPITIIEFIIFDILALSGGIGLAILYERIKAKRGLSSST